MSILFIILALLTLVSGIAVVLFPNPLHSALSLVFNLLCVAALYATLNADFLVATQIVVYAGAVMVLVLFVIMLLNTKEESGEKTRLELLAFSGLFAFLLLFTLLPLLKTVFSTIPEATLVQNAITVKGTVFAVGELLYSKYFVQFELASLLIVAGIVGAVMLAEKEKR